MWDPENCLTVRDLIQAVTDGHVSPDMPIAHNISGFGPGLSKVTKIRFHPRGALVLVTDSSESLMNDPDEDRQALRDLV
jgi:hypothetical protein